MSAEARDHLKKVPGAPFQMPGAKNNSMLRSILLTATVFVIAIAGFGSSFVFGLGYIWTTLFRVQEVSYSLLGSIPFQFAFAIATALSYTLTDRRYPPHLTGGIVLLCFLAAWITATTSWAEVPAEAWPKWDWAFKTICFAIAVPYLFRSRIQIESVLLVTIIAISASAIAVAVKVMISGGSYGASLGLASDNTGLAESSTLAVVSVMMIPLILFLKRHGLIFPTHAIVRVGFWMLAILFGIAALGSYARSGLIALAALGLVLWFRSQRRIVYGLVLAAGVAISLPFASEAWFARMSTIGSYEADPSAMGRIAVWTWTIEYALRHPLGGGFNSFLINTYTMELEDGKTMEIKAKAFHSIYFEILGEHGFVGLAIFAFLILNFFGNTHYVIKRSFSRPGLAWAIDFARALRATMVVYLCGGAFIGVAFQPYFYILIGLGISLQQYVFRALAERPTLLGRVVSSPTTRTAN